MTEFKWFIFTQIVSLFHAHYFDFVSDNIIEFWIKQSISSSPCSEKFFYIYANLLTIYDNNGIDIVKEFCASMKNENIWVFPVNTAGLHWQLIVIVNALDNEKSTVIMFFDSSARQFDPRTTHHVSLVNGIEIDILESVFCISF